MDEEKDFTPIPHHRLIRFLNGLGINGKNLIRQIQESKKKIKRRK